MKKVIYTVITNDFDILRIPKKCEGWDYVCFTDSKSLKSDFWEVRHFQTGGLDPRKASRKPKILAHQYLPEYDVSLYIDSYIKTLGDTNEFVDKLLEHKKLFYTKVHNSRPNIFEEATRIIEAGKDDPKVVFSQVLHYQELGFDINRLFENGVLLRYHNDQKVIKLCSDWWNEIERWSYRDQLSLPFVAEDSQVFGTYSPDLFYKHFTPLNKKSDHVPSKIKVFEGTPYGEDLQYGKALNEFCESAPEGSWIIVRDRDTLYLTDNGQQIIDVIKKYPDTGLFGCMTNRLGLKWQLEDGMFDETNILEHHKKAEELKEKHYNKVIAPGLPVAGLFMCFKKETWKRIKFREGDIIDDKTSIYYDWDFSLRVQKLGLPIRIMRGVYLFHFYRLHKNVRDIEHLKRIS